MRSLIRFQNRGEKVPEAACARSAANICSDDLTLGMGICSKSAPRAGTD